VDNFLAEMVELSISDNAYVRDTVTEFLGEELNSSLYGIVPFDIITLRDTFQAHCFRCFSFFRYCSGGNL
jgi:hypothetical protein